MFKSLWERIIKENMEEDNNGMWSFSEEETERDDGLNEVEDRIHVFLYGLRDVGGQKVSLEDDDFLILKYKKKYPREEVESKSYVPWKDIQKITFARKREK